MTNPQQDMAPLPEQGKKITQEYFDSIIDENINDFEMNTKEAIDDAISQCKSQGCDLSTICKYAPAERAELTEALKKLNNSISNLSSYKLAELTTDKLDEKLIETMNACDKSLVTIISKFEQDLSFRVLATQMEAPNGREILMKFIGTIQPPSASEDQSSNKYYDLTESFINALNSYIYQQSDVLSTEDLIILIKLTESDDSDVEDFKKSKILAGILNCINSSCLLCESNRQYYVENGLCENLMKLFRKHKSDDVVLNALSFIIRSLLLDDDIRHAFGKSHEHAKFIASQLNGIDTLLSIGLNNDDISEKTLANLMLTLSKLAVRNEFCQEISDKGGLEFSLKCIEEKHLKNISLIKSSLSLLKSMCNNDKVKLEATKSNAIELLKSVLDKYCKNTHICELTCSALSTLLLRNIESSNQLYALEVHRTLVQLLVIHLKNPKLIKPCCLALRNSISRCKHHIPKLIDLKIEEILTSIWNDPTMKSVHDEVKAVLRDLGLSCDLKTPWLGTGTSLAN